MGLAPGFHYLENPGRRLSVRELETYARKYGLPAHPFAQISRGEASRYAFVQQHDPGDGMVGYGALQLTPNAWGKSSRAYRTLQQMGGVRSLSDPQHGLDNQFRLARILYHEAGNSFKPWYGTKYLTDRSGEGSLGAISGGMQISGAGQAPDASSLLAAPDGSAAPGGSGGTLALLQALQGQQGGRQAVSSGGGVPAPSFSAAPPLPQGAQPVLSGGGPQPKQDPAALLAAVQASGGTASLPPALTPSEPSRLPETHGGGASSALAWAQSKLGFHESGGENRGGLADVLNRHFGMSAQPWCAMFTSAAVMRGGAPSSARTASVAEVRRKAQAGEGYQRGLVSARNVQAGDLILFGSSHIGMVQAVHNGQVRYIGGNQSDGVTIGHTTTSGGDFVRPLYGARRRRR